MGRTAITAVAVAVWTGLAAQGAPPADPIDPPELRQGDPRNELEGVLRRLSAITRQGEYPRPELVLRAEHLHKLLREREIREERRRAARLAEELEATVGRIEDLRRRGEAVPPDLAERAERLKLELAGRKSQAELRGLEKRGQELKEELHAIHRTHRESSRA